MPPACATNGPPWAYAAVSGSAHGSERAQAVLRAGALPRHMLDHRVRARIHQAGVTVVEPDQVRRLPLLAVHLNDLAVPVRVPDDVAVNADLVADGRFHPVLPPHRRPGVCLA